MHVLVTGATGFVGSNLVPALQAAGHDVRVLVRDADSYDAAANVSVFEGDLLEPGSFEDALDGVDCAYYLVHSMQAGEDFAERDRRAARLFVDGVTEMDVDRVIYLGGLGVEGESLSHHLQSRREVEAILAEGPHELTTLRAAIIIGSGSASFRMIRQIAARLPIMITPRWVQTDCQPIAIEDVIAYLVGVLDAPETAGETYEIGGPEVLTYGDILVRTARAAGRREPLILSVPVLTPKLSSYWIGFVTDVDASVARPLIEGLKNPVVVTDDSITELIQIDLTPFDTAVSRALAGSETESAEHSVTDHRSGGEMASDTAEETASSVTENTESDTASTGDE